MQLSHPSRGRSGPAAAPSAGRAPPSSPRGCASRRGRPSKCPSNRSRRCTRSRASGSGCRTRRTRGGASRRPRAGPRAPSPQPCPRRRPPRSRGPAGPRAGSPSAAERAPLDMGFPVAAGPNESAQMFIYPESPLGSPTLREGGFKEESTVRRFAGASGVAAVFLFLFVASIVTIPSTTRGAPTVDHIVIVDGPNGTGSWVSSRDYMFGDTDRFWAAAYNDSSGFIKDVAVYWYTNATPNRGGGGVLWTNTTN